MLKFLQCTCYCGMYVWCQWYGFKTTSWQLFRTKIHNCTNISSYTVLTSSVFLTVIVSCVGCWLNKISCTEKYYTNLASVSRMLKSCTYTVYLLWHIWQNIEQGCRSKFKAEWWTITAISRPGIGSLNEQCVTLPVWMGKQLTIYYIEYHFTWYGYNYTIEDYQ